MKVIAAISAVAAFSDNVATSTDSYADLERIPDAWKLSDNELEDMTNKKTVDPLKPKRVGDLNFSEMLNANEKAFDLVNQ